LKPQYPSEKLDQYMLRFPNGMRDKLKAIAAENGRSLNSEIVHRLQTTLDQDAEDAKRFTAFPRPMTIQESIESLRTLQVLLKDIGIQNDTVDEAAVEKLNDILNRE